MLHRHRTVAVFCPGFGSVAAACSTGSVARRMFVKGRVVDHTDIFFDFVERLDLIGVATALQQLPLRSNMNTDDALGLRRQLLDGIIAASVIAGHVSQSTMSGAAPLPAVEFFDAVESIQKIAQESLAHFTSADNETKEIHREISEHLAEFTCHADMLKCKSTA